MIRVVEDNANVFLKECVVEAFASIPEKYKAEILAADMEIQVYKANEVQGINRTPAYFLGLTVFTMNAFSIGFGSKLIPTIIFNESIERVFSKERIIEIARHELIHVAQLVSNRLETVIRDETMYKYWEGEVVVSCKVEDAQRYSHSMELDKPWEAEAYAHANFKISFMESIKLNWAQFMYAIKLERDKLSIPIVTESTLAAKQTSVYNR